MRIAIFGSGISGLGAAHLLSRVHEVEIFESENRAAGHTRTLRRKGVALDTGFLVHNQCNYPLLTRLVQKLGVPHVAVRDVASLTAAYASDDAKLKADGLRGRRDRAALRADARPLAPERPPEHRRGSRARLRRSIRPTYHFYLAFCEAAFRRRALRDFQLTLTRPFNEAIA